MGGRLENTTQEASRLLTAAALVFLVVFGHAPNASADAIDEVAARFVASEARRTGGDEYEEARSVKRSGAKGDGLIAFVVLYTIEGVGGGNNYRQYLVAFLNKGEGTRPTRPIVVGGKLYRAVNLERVEARQVVLKTQRYAEADAACCPSLEGTTSYRLTGTRLVEEPGRKREP
jgi:hypothetical protein